MKILFICTHNRCRSILAEAITNHYGKGLVKAASAGSEPEGKVHPLTLEVLKEMGIPTSQLHSKSWDELEGFEPDFVITVCDKASREQCPLWFGMSLRAHWSLKDPSSLKPGSKKQREAFMQTAQIIRDRVEKLCELLASDPDRTTILGALQSMNENYQLV